MIHEIQIMVIDPLTGESKPVTVLINDLTGETTHLPAHLGAGAVLVEEEPDG